MTFLHIWAYGHGQLACINDHDDNKQKSPAAIVCQQNLIIVLEPFTGTLWGMMLILGFYG